MQLQRKATTLAPAHALSARPELMPTLLTLKAGLQAGKVADVAVKGMLMRPEAMLALTCAVRFFWA